jgi:predicted permease
MKLLKSNKSLITGNKGQVALFVALIFQVLFLFFAMIVNVGLVVHHKINLQSSVDMAAYYGAMKQAELLNSIAHMNYQMRQSWKLLAWRYRVLGTAGDQNLHPYDHLHGQIRSGMDAEYSNDPDTEANRGNFLRPPFCITYNPFNESIVPEGESTCKKTLDPAISSQIIRLFTPPPVIASFIGFASATRAISINMKRAALSRCQIIGPYNYMTIGTFMLAYQLDQYVRRVSIARISRSMSQRKNDFFDINGKSVKSGAEETFMRNLTEANKESSGLNFQIYNGLAHNGCGNIPSDTEVPAPWLSEIRVFPSVFYLDLNDCSNSGTTALKYTPKNFDLANPSNVDSADNQISMPYSYFDGTLSGQPQLKERIKYIAQTLSLYNDKYRFIVGVEKNPWCQAYVGAKATTNPKIPFAPSDLTLTATAFAKPFGGRVGPWYYKNWVKGTFESTGGIQDRTDNQLPLRVKDLATLKSDAQFFANPLRIANYSKYIGDPYGLTSWRTLAHMAKAFFNLSPKSPYRTVSAGSTNTDSILLTPGSYPAPRLEDWYTIGEGIELNTQKDILAWNNDDDKISGMRVLEVAGLAPDQFDLAYYSIEPNYYDNYYKKLKEGLLPQIGLDQSFLRPDLGARIGHPTLEKFSVKDQVKMVADISTPILDFKTKLTYNVLNPVHVLTSWTNKTLFDYEETPEGYFGSCQSPLISKNSYSDPQEKSGFLAKGESVPGECVTGGRTGYSVKIVSKDLLFSPVKAGGEANAESTILNPPNDF